jgi:hypothetical protein
MLKDAGWIGKIIGAFFLGVLGRGVPISTQTSGGAIGEGVSDGQKDSR